MIAVDLYSLYGNHAQMLTVKAFPGIGKPGVHEAYGRNPNVSY